MTKEVPSCMKDLRDSGNPLLSKARSEELKSVLKEREEIRNLKKIFTNLTTVWENDM